MSLLKGYIVPHPPLLVMGSETEKEKILDTMTAYQLIKEEIKQSDAELVVVITPHGPLFVDGLCVYDKARLTGNFSKFGHKEITASWDNDNSFIEALQKKTMSHGIPFVKLDAKIIEEFDLSSDLDHGAMVPLSMLGDALEDKKVVVINYGLLAVDTLYQFGQLLTSTLEEQNKKTIIVASGDLSHYLSKDGPYGLREEGVIFDKLYVEAFEKGNWQQLLFVDDDLLDQAGECGKRSIEVLIGALDHYDYVTKKYAYEAPFGVGYLTGAINPISKTKSTRLDTVLAIQKSRLLKRVENESDVVKLARSAIRLYLEEDKIYRSQAPLTIEESGNRHGVFVSLKDAGGLRGCMGSTGGIAPTIEEEIIDMAIKAATKDPRFEEVTLEELERLTISVDILSRSEQVLDVSELDPKIYGVLVKSNHKQGLLLPDLDGIDTIESQIKIVLNKAGINPVEEEYSLYKFTVKRFY